MTTISEIIPKSVIPDSSWAQLYTVMPAHYILIPREEKYEEESSCDWFVVSLKNSSIDKKSVIFSGSFNPPHKGHKAMIEASIQMFPERKVYVEICIKPYSKPALDYITIDERIKACMNFFGPLIEGVIVSSATFFYDKINILGWNHYYLIGRDTYDRIFDPATYPNDDFEQRINFMKGIGTKFLVADRQSDKEFTSIREDMCIPIPGYIYKDDGISSTKLRASEAV